MHQRKYGVDLISDSALIGAKPIATPIELNQKLITSESKSHIGDSRSGSYFSRSRGVSMTCRQAILPQRY